MVNIIEIQDQQGGIYHPVTDAKAVMLTDGNNLQQKAESLDTQIAGKVDKVAGKGLSANDYTAEEKEKLAGIAQNANHYTHPSTHPASMVQLDQGQSLQDVFNQATPISDWNDAVTPGFYYSANDAAHAPTFIISSGGGIYGIVFRYENQVKQVATQQMGTEFKVRFCNAYNNDTWYSWMPFVSDATTSSSGLMSASDKTKLNGAAPLASPVFTGTPKAPTPGSTNNSTQIATTAFVKSQGYYQLSDYVSADCYVNGAPKYRKIATISGLGSKAFCRIDYDASYNGPVSSGSILLGRSSVKITNITGALSKEFAIVANSSSVDVYVYTGMQGRLYQFRKGPCFNWWADGSAGDISANLTFTSTVMSSGGNDVDLSVSGVVTGTIYYSQTI